jgi:two-component system sensor histidine kinase DegS
LDALRWYCKHYSGQTQIQVTFTYIGSHGRLRPEIELTCYRVIQEALTNIARYAQVSTATVGVSVSSGRVKLSIEDKGIGFDPATVRARDATFGLLSMSERIALLRGQIDIISAPGQGTHIHVEIPLGPADVQN